MNDNSLSPNNFPDMDKILSEESFPTDALTEYPDYPFADPTPREVIESAKNDLPLSDKPTSDPLFSEGTELPQVPEPVAEVAVPSEEPLSGSEQAPSDGMDSSRPTERIPLQKDPVSPAPQGEPFRQGNPAQQSVPYGHSPYGQGNPYNQDVPYGQNVPSQQGNPYDRSGPYHQEGPTQQGNPYNQSNPYGQEPPTRQNTPYGQSSPYSQGNPASQNTLFGQGSPAQQNTPYGQGRPPQQNIPYGQGNPYGNGRATPENTDYRNAYTGYNPENKGYSYGNTGRTPGYSNYGYSNSGYSSGTPQSSGTGSTPSSGSSPKKSGSWMLVLLIVGCLLIGSVSGILIANLTGSKEEASSPTENASQSVPHNPQENKPAATQPTTSTPRETQPLATASGDEKTLNQIYTENVPAIVGILNESTQTMYGQTGTTGSTGSGFIISSDGEILTNYHVVEGASTLTVTLYDGRKFPATLIGYEAESDIALIKIEAEDLPVCAIGNSDGVYVGEQIAAIGNPMGELTYTMTVGYVSALNRFVNTEGTPISMIQVDAAINPGNSGGPVFNLYGEVIGIATAKYSGTLSDGATLEGLGFAIPINDIVDILNDLRVSGKVPDRAYMGVMVSTIAPDKETYGIDHGVYVQSVDEGGSAYKAGIQAHDIIIKIGDVDIAAYENLQQILRGFRAGDETTITVYRNGEAVTLPIVFDAKPDSTETATTPSEPAPTETEGTEDPWGEFPWGDFPWGESGG